MAVISRVACFALSHEAFKSEGALHPSTFLRQGSPITLPDFQPRDNQRVQERSLLKQPQEISVVAIQNIIIGSTSIIILITIISNNHHRPRPSLSSSWSLSSLFGWTMRR